MSYTAQFSKQDYKLDKKEIVYQGFYRMATYEFEHRKFAGGWSGPIRRELLNRPDAVVMLAYDPKLDALVFVEQFRIGAHKTHNFWLMECVAGLIDKDESPEEVARREALEEAGLSVGQMEKITEYLPSPGGSDEIVHLYVGQVDASDAGGIHGLDEEGEDIKVHVFSFDQAVAMMQDGTINNAASIMGLMWLQMNKARLQSVWG